ncbi:MAG: 2-hydroxyacyl-CoA dehydratase family protein [Planctomycetota bacterium]
MRKVLERLTLEEWDARYATLKAAGLQEPSYGGVLSRHLLDGDFRLTKLRFDSSPAALRLWNFLLTEEDRLHAARSQGKTLIGAMKDLGTVPVMAYAFPNTIAFYPDGAWWIPCIMELSEGLLGIADSLGVDESFCPVRAMLGAFITQAHFPLPDLLTCSVGATCDDFSAIAQRLEGLGHPILWWEMPARRAPDLDEETCELPGGLRAPARQVALVRAELTRVKQALESLAGQTLRDEDLRRGIREANRARRLLRKLRSLVFTAPLAPLPALEMLIAEMLIIHFCSDRDETIGVLSELLHEAKCRVAEDIGVAREDAARLFWVNPVADLRAIMWVEDCGARICGTEYLFAHAIAEIPEHLPPLEALARTALADPMVGPAADRARHIAQDALAFGSEAVVISRIPGASHCALEGRVIADRIGSELHLPVVEIEVPPVSDAIESGLRTRIEALVETVRRRRER